MREGGRVSSPPARPPLPCSAEIPSELCPPAFPRTPAVQRHSSPQNGKFRQLPPSAKPSHPAARPPSPRKHPRPSPGQGRLAGPSADTQQRQAERPLRRQPSPAQPSAPAPPKPRRCRPAGVGWPGAAHSPTHPCLSLAEPGAATSSAWPGHGGGGGRGGAGAAGRCWTRHRPTAGRPGQGGTGTAATAGPLQAAELDALPRLRSLSPGHAPWGHAPAPTPATPLPTPAPLPPAPPPFS